MSVVDFARKKREDEEKQNQGKVVGQQQKTQPDSHKPTGTTSIPRERSRAQQSAASSSRTETRGVTTQATSRSSESRRSEPSQQRTTGRNLRDRGYPNSTERQSYANKTDDDRRRYNLQSAGYTGRNNSNLMDDVNSLPEANNVPDEIIQQIADKNGMTFEEAKKRISEGEKSQAFRAPGTINEDLTSKAQADYANQRRIANQKQQGTWESFMNNYGKAIADVINGPVYLAGKLTGNDWDLVGDRAREAVSNAREQHPVASNIGTFAGMATAAYGAGGGAGGRAIGGANNVSAGQVFKDTFNDASVEGASKAQAILAGFGNAARQVGVNAAKEMPIDAAVDIFPTLANDIAEGKSEKQVAANTLLNIGLNFGFNTIGDIASMVKPGLEAVRPNNVIPSLDNVGNDVVEQAVRGEVEEAAERAAKNNIPPVQDATEQIIKNATDVPYNTADEVIQPNINKALGYDNPLYKLKDAEIENLTRRGGDQGALGDAYKRFVNASAGENIDEFTDALNNYRKAVDDNGVQGLNRPIQRLEDIVNGNIPENVPTEIYGSISQNIDVIEDGLNHIDTLEGLSDLGRKHLNNSRELLNQYEAAVRSGSDDVYEIANNLNKSLNNLDNQAKKISDYNGTFSAWKGGNTPRGDLFSNTGRIQRNSIGEITPEEQEMFDSINSYIDEHYHAKPANEPTNAEIPNNVGPEAKASESVPNAESLPEASADIPNMDNIGEKKTSKWRTNTAENTGRMQGHEADLPKEDYEYWEKHESEANAQAKERYKDSKDLYSDLLNKDEVFDDADIKAAMNEWQRLMDEGSEESLKKANRLGLKMSVEGRRGGREIQAFAEFGRNTPEGQVREARKTIGDAVDKKYGKGTTEALDNLSLKITEAYENSKTVEEFNKKVADLLSNNMNAYVSKKTASDMLPKKIKGAKNVENIIKNSKSLDDIDMDKILESVYKNNKSIRLSGKDEADVYKLLKEAFEKEEGSREQEILLAKAAKIVGGKVKTTLGDKARTILYDNMLGNFKTALSRNAFGNFGYQVLEQTRSPIAAAVDKATSLVTGKHSTLGWNAEKAKEYAKGFAKGTKEQVGDMARYIDTGRSGAKGWTEALKNNKQVWGDGNAIAKFANGVDFYVKNAMELGDRPFYEANYAQRAKELRQLVDRYGADNVVGLTDIKGKDLDEVIDMLSSIQAADSVFQKHGKMSKGLTDLRNGLAELSQGALGVDLLSTSATPFTMTPGNMLEKAIEYSPFGILKNTVNTAKEAVSGAFNQKRFVDETSRNILGGLLIGGTYAGAKSGLINGGYSKDPDEKQTQMDDGFIEYGLNTPWGTYDTSDIPAVGPLMQAGGAIAENGLNPESALQAAEAITLGSALQGINKVAGTTAGYSSNSSVLDNAANTIKSAGTQLVPSLFRQTAQTIDKYKRDLGEYGTNEYYLNSILNSLPIARETLPVKYDNEGNPVLQNQGRPLVDKILENYIYPMARSEYEPSRLNEEAARIQNETGNAYSYVPKALRKDVRKWDKVAGVEYSEEQFRNYKRDLGTLNRENGEALLDSEFYQSLNDEEKEKALSDLYSGMKQVAKVNSIGGTTDDKIANAYMENKTEGVINQLQESYIEDKAKDFMDGKGISTNSNLGKAIKEAYKNGDEELANNLANDYQYLKDNNFDKQLANFINAREAIEGLDAETYVKTFKEMDTTGSGTLDQKEVLDWINTQGIKDQETMEQYYDAYYNGKSEKVPKMIDGKWQIENTKNSKSSNSTSNKSSFTLKETGNNTLDTKLKAKQKAQEEAKAEKKETTKAETAIPEVGGNWTVESSGRTYDLHNTKTYERAQAAGISDSDFLNAFHAADTDGNGKIKKAEAEAYLDALEGLSKSDKHKWFDVLVTRKSKNPY